MDKRSDIWAFGCVLYEMLTGRRAFDGEDVSETLAYVLKSEPDWSALPKTTPVAVRRLLRLSLQKDRKRRVPDIGDARIEVDEAPSDVTAVDERAPAAVPGGRRHMRRTGASRVLVAAAIAVAAMRMMLRSAPQADVLEIRLEIVTPCDRRSDTRLPFRQTADSWCSSANRRRLQRFGCGRSTQTTARALAGTEGAAQPFWSPDSRSIGFFARQTEAARDRRWDAANAGGCRSWVRRSLGC